MSAQNIMFGFMGPDGANPGDGGSLMVNDFEAVVPGTWNNAGGINNNAIRTTTHKTEGTYAWQHTAQDDEVASRIYKTLAVPAGTKFLKLDAYIEANCSVTIAPQSPFMYLSRTTTGAGTLVFPLDVHAGTNTLFYIGSNSLTTSSCSAYLDNLRYDNTVVDQVPNAMNWNNFSSGGTNSLQTFAGLSDPIIVDMSFTAAPSGTATYYLNGEGPHSLTVNVSNYIIINNGDTLRFGGSTSGSVTITVKNVSSGNTTLDNIGIIAGI